MSTLIDQRILAPAPTHVVWAVLADSAQLPGWRIDCAEVQMLTPRQFGVGTQRECFPPRGKSFVEEITAWYEGLGYEYTQLDNRSYSEWLARIRLQAVPDGTIVQWTISYAPAGLMGRVSNEISGKARVEEDCANSLRQLRRLIMNMGYEVDTDARRRQTLQPVPSVVRSSTQPIVVPAEDSAADTRPRKPEGLEEAINSEADYAPQEPEAHYSEPEPDSESGPHFNEPEPYTEPYPDLYDEEPEMHHGEHEPHYDSASTLPPGMPESLKVTPPQGTPKVDLSRMRYVDEMEDEDDQELPPEDNFNGNDTQILRPGLPPPTGERDTGQVSIWEAFGIKAPSQSDAEALDMIVKTATGELPALVLNDEEDTTTFSPLFEATVLRVKSGKKRSNPPSQDTGPIRVRPPRDD